MNDLKLLELFIAPGCPHCPNMIKIASELVKNGDIGKLDIINIAFATDLARQANVRSVPTFRIDDVTLTGVHTLAELQQWIEKSSTDNGLTDFFNQEFEQGKLDEIIAKVEQKPELLDHLLGMISNLDTPLTSRIGISAIFEHFENTPSLVSLVPRFCELATDPHESVRTDMAHFLGLSGDRSAIVCLEKLLEDDFGDVRETARESIDSILEANT